MDEPFELRQRRVPGARLEEVDLSRATFDRVILAGARLDNVDASDLDARDVHLAGARFRGVVLDRAGNYDFAWAALIVIGVTAFMLQWLMDEKPPRARMLATTAAPA